MQMDTLTQQELDPITVEVIRAHFDSSARQMRNVLIRTSFNPVIYEMVDFSLGIYNAEAELIAEGPGIPFFMGALTFAIREIVRYVGKENLAEGDVLLSTYPYWTGSHPQDAVIVKPIFVQGEIFAYTACKAHWMDLGAKDIYGVDTTDVFQEGVKILGAKVVKRGVLDKEIVDIVTANSRTPELVMGDLTAQISACSFGDKRVLELIQKYGVDTVQSSIGRILDHGEAIARREIAAMPEGEWTAEAAMDNNGVNDDPVVVKVRVRISGGEMYVDTTGSSPQQAGPVNSPLATTISFVRLVMLMIVAPKATANEGFFRPLKVNIPAGSVLNPTAPAPVFLYHWSTFQLGDAMFKAFAAAVPHRSVARSGGDIGGMLFAWNSADGKFNAGGWNESVGQGASLHADGENALTHYSLGQSRNVPIEIAEQRYPIHVECYEIWNGSGGPGRNRGGCGVRKFWRAKQGYRLISTVEQTRHPSWGIDGGGSGKANSLVLRAGTSEARPVGKISGYNVQPDERLELYMGGGGGWGNPLERPAQKVLSDVNGGYISCECAEQDYGVVIKEIGPHRYEFDPKRTRTLRAQRAAAG
jgi:N-methylhydantoinase B